MTTPPVRNLQDESGVTGISTHNASCLLYELDRPNVIMLEPVRGVSAFWGDPEATGTPGFTFTGFTWGYSGEGPNGTLAFLRACGIDAEIGDIAGMSASNSYLFTPPLFGRKSFKEAKVS